MNDLLDTLFYNRAFVIGLHVTGLMFFGGLTAYSLRRHDKRSYIPSLLVIDFGILNALVRSLFFFDLSAHPARPGGIWRLATGVILVCGFVWFERTRRRERKAQKG